MPNSSTPPGECMTSQKQFVPLLTQTIPRGPREAEVPTCWGRPPAAANVRSDEAAVVLGCLKKIYRWRVPRGWSGHDWFEEMRAEMAAAAVEADREFDPSRGVPWRGFLGSRLMCAALARYRREWSHTLRQVSLETMDYFGPRS